MSIFNQLLLIIIIVLAKVNWYPVVPYICTCLLYLNGVELVFFKKILEPGRLG
jgi:hypothetical protein